MADRVILRLWHGEPFLTESECPACGFDSVVACLTLVGVSPAFVYWCGRRVCRESDA